MIGMDLSGSFRPKEENATLAIARQVQPGIVVEVWN